MWTKVSSIAIASDIAERLDIATRQNESCNLTISLFDPTSGQPFDLTTYSFELSIDNSGSNVLLAESGTGLTITAPTSGVINVVLSDIQMGFPAGNYTYRLTATSATAKKTWIQGLIIHVAQNQIQPASDSLRNSGKTYVHLNGKDILLSVTNN